MRSDHEPCRVCGSPVSLEARTDADTPPSDGPVGPGDGVVGGGDPTVDTRTCTNPSCSTRRGDGSP